MAEFELRFELNMPKNHYNNLLLDHINGVFGFYFRIIFPYLKRGQLPSWELGRSHNCPWSTYDKVDHFKYLGTIFSSSLKWHENSDCISGKLCSRFYVFSKFKQFKPSQSQKDHFIFYLLPFWHLSSTVKEHTKLFSPLRSKSVPNFLNILTEIIF